MEIKNGVKTLYASNIVDWRKWLEANHSQEVSVWLIIYHKKSKISSITYDQAVDEALCFGWIDSKPNKRDGESYYQFFSRRKPKSKWSRINKEKVAKLLAEKRMTPAGLEMVELAKSTGTWNALDQVDRLEEPADLLESIEANPEAFQNWKDFPPSVRRGILEWILNAKTETTRQKRINETVKLAALNIRANQYRQPKSK
jgi:uncharacterized protein YdeI (YjbR/CyaY-like superfamily)